MDRGPPRQAHMLKKGYYITKQPGPNELVKRNSFEESRRQEKEFFASTESWKSSTAYIKSRTGIPKLTAELSRLLSQLIMHTQVTRFSFVFIIPDITSLAFQSCGMMHERPILLH